MVDHPRFGSRHLSVGLSLNYAYRPLTLGVVDANGQYTATHAVITHQLLGNLDLAGSFCSCLTLSASLPITLLERLGGSAPVYGYMTSGLDGGHAGLSGIALPKRTIDGVPAQGSGIPNDPRFGFMFHVYGRPDKDPFSVSMGANLWVPLRKFGLGDASSHAGDAEARVQPKVVIAGDRRRLRWSLLGAFLFRPEAHLGDIPASEGSSAGSELQVGGAISYVNKARDFAIGPEAMFTTIVSPRSYAFRPDYTGLEVLLGTHYRIKDTLQVGVAGGLGLLRQPGTPDGRLLLRIAYTPRSRPPRDQDRDRDRDGVLDPSDRCADVPGRPTADPRTNGCPPDQDGDGVIDPQDFCPELAKGPSPDPLRRGCPAGDRDGDGVVDPEDLCPETARGPHPDPARLGCPAGDLDSDGVVDPEDLCPETARGPHPDPARLGCPAGDRDSDGVFDPDDACVELPSGRLPDPARPGCPMPDRDDDTVFDADDACPSEPGAPNPDRAKHGCPGLVRMAAGKLVTVVPVVFASGQDTISPRSAPVLQALADALKASPWIKRFRVGGHTDDRGVEAANTLLSRRRAWRVLQWLVDSGVDPSRIDAAGYGSLQPIADNATEAGRATNRRVELLILDPPPTAASPSP
ncbi:MAG TPA: OmpA family protein [Kofleriaceae bacterium]|nr:OmpA family protein [Kofleriaceae bacterium]